MLNSNTIWGFIYLSLGILSLALSRSLFGLGVMGVALVIVDIAFIIAGLLMIFG